MSPIQGYIDFGNFINIALTDYAIQYRPYGATRLQTNNTKGATLPSIVRKGYDTNGSTIQPQRGDITQHNPDGLCRNAATITPPITRKRKNLSVNFVFCEVCSIFAVCYGNSRAQYILHNLLNCSRITTSEQKRAKIHTY